VVCEAGLPLGVTVMIATSLTRSSAMAIGIGIGFLLVVEGLITIVAPDAGPYLPGGTLNTLAAGGNDQLAWGAALALVVLYGVVAATVSLAVFRTRDIVS
jgi:ABC-2 type transport system permease protein